MDDNKYPLISVVIPNYKRVDSLKKAVDSVLEQTFQDFEIIIVDDCSPNIDEIENSIENIRDSRIRLIKQSNNRGGGATRNKGIFEAKGEYIAFLDSDDTWSPDKLAKQYSAIIECNEDNGLVYCKSIIKRDKGKCVVAPVRSIRDNERISDYLFVNKGFCQTSSYFLPTSLARKCLFDESLPRHQDYDFLFKLEKKNTKFVFIDESLVTIYWRDQEQNLMTKGWKPTFSEEFALSNRDSFSVLSFKSFIFKNTIYRSIKYKMYRFAFHKIMEYKLYNVIYIRKSFKAVLLSLIGWKRK